MAVSTRDEDVLANNIALAHEDVLAHEDASGTEDASGHESGLGHEPSDTDAEVAGEYAFGSLVGRFVGATITSRSVDRGELLGRI